MPRDTKPLITQQPAIPHSPTAPTNSINNDQRCLQQTCNFLQSVSKNSSAGFTQRIEPSLGNAGANWFAVSWLKTFLETIGPDRAINIDFVKIFEERHITLFNEQLALITNVSVTEIMAGVIQTGCAITMFANVCQKALECCHLETKHDTSRQCTCINCCHYFHGCLSAITSCQKIANNIIGDPGYMWAHVDMGLTLAGTTYRDAKVVHYLAASVTSAMIIFLLIVHIYRRYKDDNSVDETLCGQLADLINTIGAIGAGRSGWMWAFYIMITTVFIPAFMPGFAITGGYAYIAPAIGLGYTGISCAYNCFWPTNDGIKKLTSSIQQFVKNACQKMSCAKPGCKCGSFSYSLLKSPEPN